MAGKNKHKALAELCTETAKELLGFHISKQKIADRVNKECINKLKDEDISYSSWHRALKGLPVWEGLVEMLNSLWSATSTHADTYFSEPGDDFLEWMKNVASANWWYAVLSPDLSISSFRAWFSGRDISSEKQSVIELRFREYWQRLSWALSRTRDYRIHKSLLSQDQQREALRDYLFRLIIDDKMEEQKAIEQARFWFHAVHTGQCNIINIAEPLDPIEIHERFRSQDNRWWQDDLEWSLENLNDGKSSLPPKGAWQIETTATHTWRGRKKEGAPKDLNSELWGKRHRVLIIKRWCRESMSYLTQSETVVAVLGDDGWREPNARERAGWNDGDEEWSRAYKAGLELRNSWQRDVDELLEQGRLALNSLRSAKRLGHEHPNFRSVRFEIDLVSSKLRELDYYWKVPHVD